MKATKLISILGKKFPKSVAIKNHDFHGLMLGKPKGKDFQRILLCLDLDYLIYDEILNFKPDLIITHHPFIYGKKSYVLKNDPIKKDLYDKLNNLNICVYSYHTSFDECKDGMNDVLSNKLELVNIKPLESCPMARGGMLKYEMSFEEFNKYCLEKLNIPYSLSFNYGKKTIKTVAIIGGGGWSMFKNAKDEGYDVFISGDMPHHGQRDVILEKYNYINIAHEVENVFMEQMKKILNQIDDTLDIKIVIHEKVPELFTLKK